MTTKKKPVEVQETSVEATSDNVAILTVDGEEFVLTPDKVHRLRRQLNAAFVELH